MSRFPKPTDQHKRQARGLAFAALNCITDYNFARVAWRDLPETSKEHIRRILTARLARKIAGWTVKP